MTTDAAAGSAAADPPQPTYDEGDMVLAAAVVTQDLDDPVQHIITLSDEELLAVEGIQHRQLTPLPWADEHLADEEKRAVAAAAATRSLAARGLVRLAKIADPRRPGEMPEDEIAPAVKGTVVARRTSDWMVIAERTTSAGTAMGLFYVFDIGEGRRVIQEVYDEVGMHLFFVLSIDDFPEQFRLWVDPAEQIGEEDGEVEHFRGAEFADTERYRQLRESRAATVVHVRGRAVEEAPTFSLFAAPGQLDLMESEGEGEDAAVRIGALAASSLDELILSLVTPPEQESPEQQS